MMDFRELSPNEESVLKEVLNHILDNGWNDNKYWERRLEEANGKEELLLRSILGALDEKGFININSWPDGVPAFYLTNTGAEYFSEKERYKKEKRIENRNSTRRKIIIAFVSALIGAVINHFFDIVGWLNSIIK